MDGEEEFFANLPEYKKRLLRRNKRRKEIEKKMREDPSYKPMHHNAKLSFQDCEAIRAEFYEIPVDENFRKSRAEFVKRVADKYGVHRVTIWKVLSRKRRMKDTDLPSLNELKGNEEDE